MSGGARRTFETVLKNADNGEIRTFASITAAGIFTNVSRDPVVRAYEKGSIIRARNGTNWYVVEIKEWRRPYRWNKILSGVSPSTRTTHHMLPFMQNGCA